jgi:hypothetical protein
MSGRSVLGFLVPPAAGLVAARVAGAQGVPVPGGGPPAPTDGDASVLGPLIVVGLVIAGLLTLTVRLIGTRRRRQAEALAIAASLADALMRDPRLVGVPVVTTVRLPLARGAAPTAEARGEVPYPELRDAAIRLASDERRRVHPAADVQDRIFVAPPVLSRPA